MGRTLVGLSTFVLASPFADEDVGRFKSVADMGYDVIEVCIENPELIHPEVIAEEARRCGLGISICGAFGAERDMASPSAVRRQTAMAYLKYCVDVAQRVESPHVAGPMYSATGRAELMSTAERASWLMRAAEGLRQVADYAAERAVALAIEPLNRFETDMINTVDQALELCDLIDRSNVGLLLDTFHMNIEEKRIGEAIRRAGTRLLHVQVSENDRGTPGSGHVPWLEVFEALHDVEYEGWIVVESFLPTVEEIARAVSLWRPVASSMEALARDGLAFIRQEMSLVGES